MSGAGAFRDRAAFERQGTAAGDGYGNARTAWQAVLTVWADLREMRGSESEGGGAMEAAAVAELRVRHSPEAAAILASDRVRVRGRLWEILSVHQPGAVPDALLFRLRERQFGDGA